MGMLRNAGAVAFTDGDNPITDSMVMRRILSYARAHDLLVCPFPEDRALAADGVMNDGEIAMRLGLAGMPTQAETIMIERDMRLLELTGARYHAALVSTKDAIDAIRRAKAQGLKVTAAAAPYNFSLNDMSVVPYRTFAKTKPPLRSEADREALVLALADGTIDVICSSDQPEDPESKRQPFAQAEFGAIGLETLLPISLELYHNGALSLSDTLAKLTVAPAKLLNLPTGTLSPGQAADLVLFDPAKPWVIDALELLSKSKNTPFDGKPTQGKVLRTVVAGRTIFEAKE
jgi:dihydroorotase